MHLDSLKTNSIQCYVSFLSEKEGKIEEVNNGAGYEYLVG